MRFLLQITDDAKDYPKLFDISILILIAFS